MSEEKPQIHYPCEWRFKLIGEDLDKMKSAIGRVLSEKEYTQTRSNSSRSGKFNAINIDLMLFSDKERLELYEKFQLQPEFRFVI